MKFKARAVKKILLWTTLLQLLITAQPIVIKASPEATVKVEPQTNTARVGESFPINITVADVQNLFGLEATLYWNPSVLQMIRVDVRLGADSHQDGVLNEPVDIWKNRTSNEEGKYQLVGYSKGRATPSFNGSGTILRLIFRVTDVGSCELNLETKLASKPPLGGVSSPIIHTTIDGFFSPVQISVHPLTIAVGESLNVSGSVTPAQMTQVLIQYREEGETDWVALQSIETNEGGNYQHMWQPQEGGEYEVRARATIEGKSVTSYSVFVAVEEVEQPDWPRITATLIVVIIIVVTAAIIVNRIRRLRS